MEEFVKYTVLMRPHFELFGDRYSERVERREKAMKLVAAAEKEDGGEGNEVGKPATAGVDQSNQSHAAGKDGGVADVVNGVNVAGI